MMYGVAKKICIEETDQGLFQNSQKMPHTRESDRKYQTINKRLQDVEVCVSGEWSPSMVVNMNEKPAADVDDTAAFVLACKWSHQTLIDYTAKTRDAGPGTLVQMMGRVKAWAWALASLTGRAHGREHESLPQTSTIRPRLCL